MGRYVHTYCGQARSRGKGFLENFCLRGNSRRLRGICGVSFWKENYLQNGFRNLCGEKQRMVIAGGGGVKDFR